jgi:heat shock protein 5
MMNLIPTLIMLASVVFANSQEVDDYVIGIDLGTTFSCVGIYKKDDIEGISRTAEVVIIQNEFGNRITPSYVAFNDEERLVGDAAKNQATTNPERSINVVKRLIGREFDD